MQTEEGEIRNRVLTELARRGSRFVPAGVSARHVHLSEKDIETLFGSGYRLQTLKALSQPGQFAAKEQVTVVGPKGALEKVRILGPARGSTQVELALSDALRVGIRAPVRMSGDLHGTPGCTLRGPAGEVSLPEGVIVAARHLHMSTAEAEAYGLESGDRVSIRISGARPCILGDVVVRSGSGHELEVHLDTDEANAGLIENGALAEIVAAGETSCAGRCASRGRCGGQGGAPKVLPAETREPLPLVTERDINDAVQSRASEVVCAQKALITPAAADRAAETSIRITRV